MSFNNSDKEFYYSLYLKFNRQRIEQILNIEIDGDIELDKNFYGRKVDFYSVCKDGRELFMELQLSQSDNIHLQQLIRIIEQKELNNYVLVWGAMDFKEDMLKEIEQNINNSNKNIHFVALKLNAKVMDYLHKLNSMYVNEVIDNLKILDDIRRHFTIKEIFYKLRDEKSVVCKKEIAEVLDLSKKQDVVKYLLKELRRQISYYPSIHRNKQLYNNVIILAGGKAGITYACGINRKGYLYLEIRFEENQKQIFESLLEREEEICDELDYMAEFDIENRKIGTYLYCSHNKRNTLIKQIARMTHKYIQLFSKYTFPNEIKDEI